MTRRGGSHLPTLVRDFCLFVAGLVGILNEGLVRQGEPRLYLLLAYGAMLGLPAFLPEEIGRAFGSLRRRNGRDGNGNDTTHPSDRAGLLFARAAP